MQFQVGDVVQLKSGGPHMTIQYVSKETEDVTCVWFEGTTEKREDFNRRALVTAA